MVTAASLDWSGVLILYSFAFVMCVHSAYIFFVSSSPFLISRFSLTCVRYSCPAHARRPSGVVDSVVKQRDVCAFFFKRNSLIVCEI